MIYGEGGADLITSFDRYNDISGKVLGIGTDDDNGVIINAEINSNSTTIQFGDGSKWKFNHSDRNWSYAD